MSKRDRPVGCCESASPPIPIDARDRDRLINWFKALGDETRFEIYRLIAGQSAPICACDVVGQFDLKQPTVSHHMRVLVDSGLVRVSRRGIWAYYELDPDGWEVVKAGLEQPGRLLAAR